jgi:hypothetical protein
MKDLRKNVTVSDSKPTRKFKPLKWLNRNRRFFIFIFVCYIIFNLIFNPGGVSSFISSWVSEFVNNWNV